MLETKEIPTLEFNELLKPEGLGFPMLISAFMSVLLVGLMAIIIYYPIFSLKEGSSGIDLNDFASHKNLVTLRVTANKSAHIKKRTVISEKKVIKVDKKPNLDSENTISAAVESTEENTPVDELAEEAESSSNQYALVEYSQGNRMPPIYPQRALMRNIEGYVLVEFTINSDGSVSDIVVVESDPKNVFENAVINAVKKFKYSPKIVEGKAVAVKGVKNRFEFKLDS